MVTKQQQWVKIRYTLAWPELLTPVQQACGHMVPGAGLMWSAGREMDKDRGMESGGGAYP